MKNVNGVNVPMSAQEEQDTLTEWAANEAADLVAPAPIGSPASQIIGDPKQLAALKAAILGGA